MRMLKALMLLLCCSYTILYAQPTTPQSPCQTDTNYQQFDFWLGEWRVENAQGQYQGTNIIEKSADGCLIKESWTSAAGNHGFSLNYYNPRTDKWTQNWVSAGSVIDYSGGLVNEQMILEGSIYYQARDLKAKFRGTWTLLDDGRVRQFFEQYNAEEQVWSVWFEGFYSKMETTKK